MSRSAELVDLGLRAILPCPFVLCGDNGRPGRYMPSKLNAACPAPVAVTPFPGRNAARPCLAGKKAFREAGFIAQDQECLIVRTIADYRHLQTPVEPSPSCHFRHALC
jgi:hypothetical protein